MGFCPIPYECNGVGACFEASRAAERAYYEAQEADYYAEQEAEYHREMERSMGLTTDPSDPRLGHGVDAEPIDQHEVYLVLSEEERGKGFVWPYCESYVHAEELGGCGAETRMGIALSETYARDPHFYGATYCVGCRMHKPVGEDGEFYWTRNLDGKPWKVGT